MLDELKNDSERIAITENEIVTKRKDIEIPDYTQQFDETNLMIQIFNESEGDVNPIFDPEFVQTYFMVKRLSDKVKEMLDTWNREIKMIVETNETGSFQSNGMAVKYTSATTSTTIDSKKLKANYPDIAAECSKVSSRSSSVSISESTK